MKGPNKNSYTQDSPFCCPCLENAVTSTSSSLSYTLVTMLWSTNYDRTDIDNALFHRISTSRLRGLVDSSKPFYCRVIQLRHSYIVFQLKSIIDARHLFLIYGTRRSILGCRQSFLSLQWTYRLSVYYMKDRILLYQNHQQYNQGSACG